MSDAISLRSVTKTYGSVRAVDDLSLSVPTGTTAALLGPNGAGKSTLFKILATLTNCDAGEVTLAHHSVTRDPQEVRRRIGYLTQGNCSDPYATPRDNLLFEAKLRRLSTKERRVRVAALLDQFGLLEHAARWTSQLSGGLRRRLEIALCTIHRPPILLLDEPTVGLDPDARIQAWVGLKLHVGTTPTTLLFSTHDLYEAERYADFVFILDAGRLVSSGTPRDLKAALNGNVFSFEFEDGAQTGVAAQLLAKMFGDQNVAATRLSVRCVVPSSGHELDGTLILLRNAGVSPRLSSVSVPTLGDVYFSATRKYFQGVASNVQ